MDVSQANVAAANMEARRWRRRPQTYQSGALPTRFGVSFVASHRPSYDGSMRSTAHLLVVIGLMAACTTFDDAFVPERLPDGGEADRDGDGAVGDGAVDGGADGDATIDGSGRFCDSL